MSNGYKSFVLVWAEREIEVSYQASWLRSAYRHNELRCGERLPVTETGYRSCFVRQAEFDDDAEVADFVTAWLDDVAKGTAWQTYIAQSRQLKLF